ncbi:hypothetical protein MUP35_00810 [Patescibacteria group bacterium]|nr:hypothetical protein [Patescibacteria group bacterium]
MKIRIRRTKDYQEIFKTMEAIGSETHDLVNTDLAWVASMDSKDVGLVGLRNLTSDYVIIDDGPATDIGLPKDRQLKIKKTLFDKVKDYIWRRTKMIYSMNAEDGIKFLESVGFAPIGESQMPKGFSHPCLVCPKKGKSCFPKLMLLKLK